MLIKSPKFSISKVVLLALRWNIRTENSVCRRFSDDGDCWFLKIVGRLLLFTDCTIDGESFFCWLLWDLWCWSGSSQVILLKEARSGTEYLVAVPTELFALLKRLCDWLNTYLTCVIKYFRTSSTIISLIIKDTPELKLSLTFDGSLTLKLILWREFGCC